MNKAIASLALLKVIWDRSIEKTDYIQSFVPFITTLIQKKRYERIQVNTIGKDFQIEFGLQIPYHPMLAILGRATKAGYIENRAGKFVPVYAKILEGDFTEIAGDQERKFESILERFTQFCRDKYKQNISPFDAEKVFISFLKEHDLDILFINQELPSLLPEASASLTQKHLINSFIKAVYTSDPETFNFLVEISVGHIIANTLSYYGLDDYQCNLACCNFYLDVTILFAIIGIDGTLKMQANVEFLHSLISSGASLFIFRHTYDELLGILEGALQWLEKSDFDIYKANRPA